MHISRIAAVAALSVLPIVGGFSAAANASTSIGHVSLTRVIGGDRGHEAIGRATISIQAPLRRSGQDGGRVLGLAATSAPCSPRLQVYVRNLATRESPSRQIAAYDKGHRLRAIAHGVGSAGPWRLDEISDTSGGSTPALRRWLGTASYRIGHNRFSRVIVSGSADRSCGDNQFLEGDIVSGISHLLDTAHITARIR
jgi:hypothetical protein